MTSPARRNPVLLLGGSGFLGSALAGVLGPDGAISTHYRHSPGESVFFDALHTPVSELISGLPAKPAAAVFLFANTGIDACARDPAGTAALNVDAAVRTIDELRALGIMPVFASSDAVFDGSRPMWREDDVPRPILTYGRQKLAVERHLGALPAPWAIVRLPKLLAEKPDPRCMLSGWLDALGRSGRILCATDQFFTPCAALDAARGIAKLVEARAHGLFHLGGPERLSRRALLEIVLREYRERATVRAEIVDCALGDIRVAERRPLDTSLSSALFLERFGERFRDMAAVAASTVAAHFAVRHPGE